MKGSQQITKPSKQSIASYAKRNAPKVKRIQRQPHKMSESVRQTDYEGHRIVIKTHYEVTVDGVPLSGHLMVTDSGNVHYHPIPNFTVPSAIDLVKHVIDTFPEAFQGPLGRKRRKSHHPRMKMS